MYAKMLAVAAVGALVSTGAFAQDSKPSSATQNASAKGEWQSSKLIHMNVYNGQNEKIGDIKELMLDKSGKINDVVIGVGGFLGMGEHDVAVKFDQLKWSNGPATTGSAQPATAAKNTDRNYPDHAVLNATKDQLKAMKNLSTANSDF
jgi:sporulation protein YlmC with PRC-barrel domain